jgi:hypothetical protein
LLEERFFVGRYESVHEQRHNQTGGSKPAKSASPWVRPELCRFRAGAAEFGDVSNPDGQPGFS